MEFGVFILAQQRGYHQNSQQVIPSSIEQTVAAEQAGFNTAWDAEHHLIAIRREVEAVNAVAA